MHGGAATGDENAIDFAQFLRRQVQAAELRRAFLHVEAATHRILDGDGLLEDFLEHEMGEVAQFVLALLVIDLADFETGLVLAE